MPGWARQRRGAWSPSTAGVWALGPRMHARGSERLAAVGVEGELGLRRSAGGRYGRRPVRQLQVEQDGANGGRIGEEGQDPHLPSTGGAQQRQHLVDPGEQESPEGTGAAGGWALGGISWPGRGRDGRRREGTCPCGGYGPAGRGREGFRAVLLLLVVSGSSADGHDSRPEAGVGCEQAVVALAMDAGWWQKPGDPRDQIEGCEHQDGAPLKIGLGEAVDQLCLGVLQGGQAGGGVEPLESERGAGAVTHQPFQVCWSVRAKVCQCSGVRPVASWNRTSPGRWSSLKTPSRARMWKW